MRPTRHRTRLPSALLLAGLLLLGLIAMGCSGPVESGVDAGSADEVAFVLGGHRYHPERVRSLELPKVLREISGLTLDEAGRAFAHDDERGIVYQIDYDAGRVVKRFALEGGVKADFEGIAAVGERLFLVTSTGEIYETGIGAADAMVPYTRHRQTRDCEVEGLAHDAGSGALLVACKNLPKGQKGIVIHRWEPADAAYAHEPALVVSRRTLRDFLAARGLDDVRKVQPTGVALAANGNLILVAARQHLLLELSADGTPVAVARLDPARHRQAEGIAITGDGRLLIADEGDSQGDRKSRGLLSIYEPGT